MTFPLYTVVPYRVYVFCPLTEYEQSSDHCDGCPYFVSYHVLRSTGEVLGVNCGFGRLLDEDVRPD